MHRRIVLPSKMKVCVLFFSMLCFFKVSQCARLLIVYPMPSPSHQRLGDALARGLLKHGFDVTMITPFETKNLPENYTEIVITGMTDKFEENKKSNIYVFDALPSFAQMIYFNGFGKFITEYVLQHPNMQKLLNSNQKFDAVIIEQVCNDAMKMLAHHFDAPLIVASSIGANAWISAFNGNPVPPSYVPDMLINYGTRMSFLQRSYNFLMNIVQTLNYHLEIYKTHREYARKFFPNHPELDTVLYNASLVLLNSHESINIATPYVPNTVSIGGYHVTPPKPLPKDLKDFMDNAAEGVIYFSMGSNLVPSEMPPKIQEAILKVLGSRNEKVLWKWDQENLKNKPPNVMISKWFPQQDILSHPNLKLFITHCGLLSITETIYHGVPILGFPVFGDQMLNAERAETLGFGRTISFSKITEESLSVALNELLDNPRYRENAQYRSKLFHDRPQKPMDLAAYWVGYVIRHRGAPHLRVAGIDMCWYQYLLLDVVAAFFGVVVVIYLILSRVFRLLCQKGARITNKKFKKK